MTLSRTENARLDVAVQKMRAEGVPFAMATVVRTVDATSAKPGGKALLDASGAILMGWVGGGCARSAVSKSAREAIETGKPQFVSLRPQELLDSEGLEAGETRDGVRFARNGCPSKGTMDIFVEPVLPAQKIVIFGQGLVAIALSQLAGQFDFDRTLVVPEGTEINEDAADRVVAMGSEDAHMRVAQFVVVATQGNGDLQALRAGAKSKAKYVSFVGSRRKFATISARLIAEEPGLEARLQDTLAPAGLHINAITPEEIALSVLAQITQIRRAGDRTDGGSDG